jgi:hypothetical protein
MDENKNYIILPTNKQLIIQRKVKYVVDLYNRNHQENYLLLGTT